MDLPTLTHPAVRLEPLTLDHVPALCEVGLEEEIWRWMTTRTRDEADMRAWVETALRERDRVELKTDAP